MRILMTGSHGFVGTNLIEALSGEYEIIRWDAREDKAMPNVDAVIHLAGLAHDTKHTTEAEAYFKVNTVLTQQIYNRFLESSAKKFIFFSSIKAQDGDTAYAKSKKAAEEIIIKNEELRMKNGQSTYILRPCMIHGKGNKGNLNLRVKWVKKGLPWPLVAFENKRSFASMGNVTYVISELLKKDVESGVYNICDDEAVSTNELIEQICECMGKKARMWRIPQGLMKGIAKMGDALHLPLNSERLGKLTEDYVIDNQKIKQVLGIGKMPMNARDGIRLTVICMVNEMNEK
jgi:nucleoside-diphosphate-sugar epimerase